MKVFELFGEINIDSKGANRTLDNVSKKFTSAGRAMTLGVTTPLVGIGALMVKVASDAEETASKFDAVFKGQSETVRAWAEETAGSMNRSSIEWEGYLGTLQDTFVPLGFARDQAAELSKNMVVLAEDLASFNNLNTADVVRDLQSALVGNTETLRKYGVVASQAAIEEYALSNGLIASKSELDANIKAQVIYAMTVEATTDAQGDAARTSGSFANQMKGLQAQMLTLGVELGEELLPILTRLIESVIPIIQRFANMDDGTQQLILTMAAVVAAAGPVALAIGAIASPVGLVVAAIGLLIAAGVHLYQNWDEIKPKIIAVWNGLKDKALEIFNGITTFFTNIFVAWPNAMRDAAVNMVLGFINGINSQIQAAKDTVQGFAGNVLSWFRGVLDMRSPSKEFDKIGGGSIDGFVTGWTRSTPEAIAVVKATAEELIGTFEDMMGLGNEGRERRRKARVMANELADAAMAAEQRLLDFQAESEAGRLQRVADRNAGIAALEAEAEAERLAILEETIATEIAAHEAQRDREIAILQELGEKQREQANAARLAGDTAEAERLEALAVSLAAEIQAANEAADAKIEAVRIAGEAIRTQQNAEREANEALRAAEAEAEAERLELLAETLAAEIAASEAAVDAEIESLAIAGEATKSRQVLEIAAANESAELSAEAEARAKREYDLLQELSAKRAESERIFNNSIRAMQATTTQNTIDANNRATADHAQNLAEQSGNFIDMLDRLNAASAASLDERAAYEKQYQSDMADLEWERRKKVNEALDAQRAAEKQLADDVMSVTGAMLGGIAQVGDAIGGKLGNAISTIASVAQDAMSVVQAFTKDVVSGIMAVIAVAVKWITDFFTQARRRREAELKRVREEIDEAQSILTDWLDEEGSFDTRFQELANGEQRAFDQLESLYRQGLLSYEEYEQERLRITEDFEAERLKLEVRQLESERNERLHALDQERSDALSGLDPESGYYMEILRVYDRKRREIEADYLADRETLELDSQGRIMDARRDLLDEQLAAEAKVFGDEQREADRVFQDRQREEQRIFNERERELDSAHQGAMNDIRSTGNAAIDAERRAINRQLQLEFAGSPEERRRLQDRFDQEDEVAKRRAELEAERVLPIQEAMQAELDAQQQAFDLAQQERTAKFEAMQLRKAERHAEKQRAIQEAFELYLVEKKVALEQKLALEAQGSLSDADLARLADLEAILNGTFTAPTVPGGRPEPGLARREGFTPSGLASASTATPSVSSGGAMGNFAADLRATSENFYNAVMSKIAADQSHVMLQRSAMDRLYDSVAQVDIWARHAK